MDTSTDALVVGAGFAGLAAAVSLQDAGASVRVLEARERVGGRVWSSQLENGSVVELGAEWIFPAFATLRELADRFGLALVDTGVDYAFREGVGPGGASVQAQQALLERARSTLAALGDDDRRAGSVGSFLDGLAGDETARATLRSRFEGTCAMDLDLVSLAMAAEEDLFSVGAAGPCARLSDGNQALAVAMAASLPDVRLGRVVDRIALSPDGVVVGLGSERVSAAVLVLAVPAPIAARMPIEPGLPDAVAVTLRELPMGQAAKLAVATRGGRPAPRARQSAEVATWSWTASGEGGRPRQCVTAFAGGARAMAALGLDRGRITPWRDLVATMHPDLTLTGEQVVYVWGDDPFTLGAYAAWDARSYERAAVLREPIGRLVPAGEHTAADGFHGTMEGALRSGRRAAEQALAILR